MRCGCHFLAAMIAASAVAGCIAQPAPRPAPTYLFYLHGKIVEDLGPQGVSERFGKYDYPAILAAFGERGFDVVSEVRPKDTDASAYADKIVAQLRSLLARGVDPSRVTVVGASKGGVIAALVSDRLKQPGVRYVLLAPCNDWLVETYDPHLTGRVLSIYDRSDDIGQSCAAVRDRSPEIAEFREIRLETGLGHGILYRPMDQWMDPTAAWAKR